MVAAASSDWMLRLIPLQARIAPTRPSSVTKWCSSTASTGRRSATAPLRIDFLLPLIARDDRDRPAPWRSGKVVGGRCEAMPEAARQFANRSGTAGERQPERHSDRERTEAEAERRRDR